jgi:hypothetical protein
MKLRNLSELCDFLDAQLSWRKREMINLLLLHKAAREHHQVLLRRAGIALLYAHWEGFVKAAGTAYLNFVHFQHKPYKGLKSNFIALGAKKYLNDFSATSKGRIICEASRFFVDELGRTALIPWKSAIKTNSNLSSEVARDIIAVLGLEYKPYEKYDITTIERLRKERNSVAHGEKQDIGPADYATLHESVLELLEIFNTQIRNAATTQAYLAQMAISQPSKGPK